MNKSNVKLTISQEQIEEKEALLKPWLNYINDNNIDVNINEKNEFSISDLEEYKKLYYSWVSVGNKDIFKQAFGVAAQGVGIGCKPGTTFYATYTGDKCDLKNI